MPRNSLNRRNFLKTTAALGASALSHRLLAGDTKMNAKKPNIVLIFPDQQRADALGFMGDDVVITPHLDKLASQALVFDRAVCNSPLCMPARSSLASGQYVNVHGAWRNGLLADKTGPSHIRNVRDAGYYSAMVGKTHLYRQPGHTKAGIPDLIEWGYREAIDTGGGNTTMSPYTDYLAEKGLLEVNLEHHRATLKSGGRGVRVGNNLLGGKGRGWDTPPSIMAAEDHLDGFILHRAARWIRDYSTDKPFYLQVCPVGPHPPFDSPAEYRARYDADDMQLPIMDEHTGPTPPLVKTQFDIGRRLDSMGSARARVLRANYYGKVTLIDDGIGAVIDALTAKGLMDNTWIVYTSDHGELLGDHWLEGKSQFYAGALNIPFFIRPPGGIAGWRTAAQVDQIDIAATLVDIAAGQPLAGSPGKSLKPKVDAGPKAPDAQEGRDHVFSELSGFSMVRSDRYRMAIDVASREVVELYDLVDDRKELHNRANDTAMAQVREQLLMEQLTPFLAHMDKAKFDTFRRPRPVGYKQPQGR